MLASELEAEKIEPWLCEIDIEFGQNFLAEIEKALRKADLTVLFLVSPEAARSDWTQLEWTSVMALEISEIHAVALGCRTAARMRGAAIDPGFKHCIEKRLTILKKRGTRLLIGLSDFATCAV